MPDDYAGRASAYFERAMEQSDSDDYGAAIESFDACLCADPPPPLAVVAFFNLAVAIHTKFRFGERDGAQVPDEEFKWYTKLSECIRRAIAIYEQILARDGAPDEEVRDTYTRAKEIAKTDFMYGITRRDARGELQWRDLEAIERLPTARLRCLERSVESFTQTRATPARPPAPATEPTRPPVSDQANYVMPPARTSAPLTTDPGAGRGGALNTSPTPPATGAPPDADAPAKYCPKCQQTYPARFKFCQRDGGALSELGGASAPPTPANCPTCGAVVRANWRYCGKCRAPIHAPAAGGEQFVAAEPFAATITDAAPSVAAGPAPTTVAAKDHGVAADPGAAYQPAAEKFESAKKFESGEKFDSGANVAEAFASGGVQAAPANAAADLSPVSASPAAAFTATPLAESSTATETTAATEIIAAPATASTHTPASVAAPAPASVAASGADAAPPEPAQPARSGARVGLVPILAVAGGLMLLAMFGGGVWYLLRGRAEPAAQPSPPPVAARAPGTTTATAPPDPAAAAPAGMVYVAGGTFEMGRDDGDEYERPAHTVKVAPFYLDETEVTCAQYAEFIAATGLPPPLSWRGGQFAPGDERKPVTGVTWIEANAYAQWAGKRLPTEAEWEFAARGAAGRRYPWGDDWRPEAVVAGRTQREFDEVKSHPDNVSPAGAYDMVGNAWEWTASDMQAYPGGALPATEPALQAAPGVYKVLRGGCWQSNAQQATATYRYGWPAQGGKDYRDTGFRCAKTLTAKPGPQ